MGQEENKNAAEKSTKKTGGKEGTRDRQKDVINAAVAGAGHEVVQRYGDAAKQHFVAYSGADREAGKALSKGLKQVAQGNVNPEYEFQNIHQQAGFSAEIKDTARTNAENIIQKKPIRKMRTDDLGRVNDPLYDTVMIDENGNILEGSGAQMKFLGASKNDPSRSGDAARALEKLQSKKFEKYLKQDAKIEVPSDQYDQMIQEANAKIESLKRQLESQKGSGNAENVQKLQAKIAKLEHIKKNLRKSNVSSKEAVFARNHPKLSTAADVAKISHRAGVQTAQTAVLIGGSTSIVRNLVALYKGEEDVEEALKNVAKDTTETAIVGYGTGFAGSALKGAMQNAKSQSVRALSKTNVAGTMVAMTVSATKTLTRYFKGEIDGVECMETLGEQGVGMISTAMGSAALAPVFGSGSVNMLIGGMAGGLIGYAVGAAAYGVLMQALKDAKMAHEERIQIEKACEEQIKLIREYRASMEKLIQEYLTDSMGVFRESFKDVKDALAIGDVDGFIESTNTITENFGGKALFSSMEEFNSKMMAGSTFKL